MAKKEFVYEVKECFGVVSTAGVLPLELNLISYNGADPKFDLRKWREKENGERTMQKGITLTRGEMLDLRDFLNGMEEI